MNITQYLRNEVLKTESHVPLSGVTAYHLLSGSLALASTTIESGMATTLYTGNGTTQSIVTGVDMASQWGNDVSETFGGLVWIKGRSGATNNYLVDTVRGATHDLYSNATTADTTEATGLTAFGSTGFNIGALAGMNTNTATYASWNFQTTHRRTGTTNHGKAFTEHYNPYTGFTIIKYEGSGLAGHEIPHSLGRKLGFVTTKILTSAGSNWISSYKDTSVLTLNTTGAEIVSTAYITNFIDSSITMSIDNALNATSNTYILYGWANSYFDEANTLIGNYEIGVYQGTGAAGNKVTTRGKPAWVMIRRLDSTGNWYIVDNQRGFTSGNSNFLSPNLSAAEASHSSLIAIFNPDGFTHKGTSVDVNASGGQYLYMVVYDNDSGSGKSKYPKATDTTNVNINALIPLAQGIDSNGAKNIILSKNETITGLTYTAGKNYIYYDGNGNYGISKCDALYNSFKNDYGYEHFSVDILNTQTNKWYHKESKLKPLATSTQPLLDTSCIAYYKFDGNANDELGNYNGIVVGCNYVEGKIGQAINFLTQNDYVSVPWTLLSGTASRSISFNMYISDNQSTTAVIGTNYNGQRGFGLLYTGAGAAIGNNDGTAMNKNEWHILNGGANNGDNVTRIPMAQPNAGWYNIVLVMNTSTASYSLYVNKELIGTVYNAQYTLFNTLYNYPIYIGKNPYSLVSVGPKLDNFRFFNKALNYNEIESLYSIYDYTTTEIPEGRNYLNHIVYADHNGQVTYVEELPKIEYKDVIKANEYQGKNACTAWVNFDGTTTPPTIRDSYNVKAVIRTATGVYDVYFKTPMDNVNYAVSASCYAVSGINTITMIYSKTVNKVSVTFVNTATNANLSINPADISVQIFGGKN